MAEVWIVNASPLISLARIGHVHLLAALAADVVVPEGVVTEVGRGPQALGTGDLGVHRVVRLGEMHPTVAAWDLGLGEGEVLSWTAATPGGRAILDDGAARQCAAALGVAVRGTLGVRLGGEAGGYRANRRSADRRASERWLIPIGELGSARPGVGGRAALSPAWL